MALHYSHKIYFIDNPEWTTALSEAADEPTFGNSTWWDSYAECPLMDVSAPENKLRMVTELIILIGSLLYLIAALREARFLGYKMFVENLVNHYTSSDP